MSKTPNTKTAMGKAISRRSFMGRTAVAVGAFAAPVIIPASARGADGQVAPSNRITLGQIGHGMVGKGHLRRLAYDPEVEVLALCEVDRTRLDDGLAVVKEANAERTASGEYSGCAAYRDYRELLARDDIDAVVIATPDHWHSALSIHAAQSGKDVYCEKPNSITIDEGRQLVKAIQGNGRIFQNGSQYRTSHAIRKACDFIRKGGLGKVTSAFTLWGRIGVGGGRFEPYAASLNPAVMGRSYVPMDYALPGEPTPEGLDWDLWLGPALWRPYNSLYHTNPMPGVVPWSFCEDFGVGPSTWYHSHAADVLQYALGYEEGGPVELIHPSSNEFPTLTCRYANGVLLHLVEGWGQVKELYGAVPEDAPLDGNFGGVVVGERGWLTTMSANAGVTGGPEELMAEYKAPEHDVDLGGKDHHANWFECIKTRGKPYSHEEIGHRAASLGHLTIIAYKLGRSLKWDPVREVFPEDEQANRLLRRARRAPWHT
ncbi:MAG TPA: Gfo/Idh/MocA family oxidoreductase [Candidatus Hydrogenedentes bacterium]|nr:Gfo/Idh/MocA family oxidoreductase [Candidatus Hydrogenedentota bacterium]HPG65573.1 Gfo/Idh/MocA family oxidoreductase [Candidatus Hydrogenedentota bacterium]